MVTRRVNEASVPRTLRACDQSLPGVSILRNSPQKFAVDGFSEITAPALRGLLHRLIFGAKRKKAGKCRPYQCGREGSNLQGISTTSPSS